MNYRSVADLNRGILHWIPRLPRDLELIVGVPRSGLLAANLLALHLNLPLADLDGFLAGRIFKAGERCPTADSQAFLRQPRAVLVLDDSVLSGQQIRKARARVRALERKHLIRYAGVYVQPGMEHLVDYYCELLSRPRVFEWHLMHHGNLRHWCVDIDGVLCADPTQAENDDGPSYLEFLRNVPPQTIPSKEIGWLVTCRLEKYRAETEAWLRRHGIVFRHLFMMGYPNMASRRAAGEYASFKADVYKTTGAPLFIESSSRQAAEIAKLSGKCVFCFETREMVHPDRLPQGVPRNGRTISHFLRLKEQRIRQAMNNFLKG